MCAKFILREQGYELEHHPSSLLVPRMMIELSSWLWMVPYQPFFCTLAQNQCIHIIN